MFRFRTFWTPTVAFDDSDGDILDLSGEVNAMSLHIYPNLNTNQTPFSATQIPFWLRFL